MKTQATLMLAAAALLPAAVSAQTSAVTVYGSIDGGVRYQTNVDAAGNGLLSTTSGNYYPNRLGFRGKEDLGNGLNAHFQLESGFNDKTGALDNTNNVLFNRTAAVGLGGADSLLALDLRGVALVGGLQEVAATFAGKANFLGLMNADATIFAAAVALNLVLARAWGQE